MNSDSMTRARSRKARFLNGVKDDAKVGKVLQGELSRYEVLKKRVVSTY